jgi:hypothetical protein
MRCEHARFGAFGSFLSARNPMRRIQLSSYFVGFGKDRIENKGIKTLRLRQVVTEMSD